MKWLLALLLAAVWAGPAAKEEVLKATPRTFLGFRLTQVDRNSVYDKAGLRVGDLVKSLNGKPVRHPDDLKQLPVILERDKKIEVKVVRDGKNVTLRYRRFKKK